MRALLITLGLSFAAFSQVKTEVPPVEAGAKPVTVEKIKIRGAGSRGQSRGQRRYRDAIVYLPPGYPSNKRGSAIRSSTLSMATSIGAERWSKEIHTPQVIEGAFAQGRAGDDRCSAGLENRAQRIHVFEFGHNR